MLFLSCASLFPVGSPPGEQNGAELILVAVALVGTGYCAYAASGGSWRDPAGLGSLSLYAALHYPVRDGDLVVRAAKHWAVGIFLFTVFGLWWASEMCLALNRPVAWGHPAAAGGDAADYELPDLELLLSGDEFSFDQQEKEVRRKAKILEKTFANFGFRVKVVEIETGPVIAQYEVQLEAGLRLSKITGLADDLAIALRVPSVRIVAPIPGKNTVGIEVPNSTRQIVHLREVIEEANGKIAKMRIPLFLGKDVSGNPLTVDAAHLTGALAQRDLGDRGQANRTLAAGIDVHAADVFDRLAIVSQLATGIQPDL